MQQFGHRGDESHFKGEQSDRFFLQGDYWFYKTRNDEVRGPYDTMEHALKALAVYVECLQAEIDYQQLRKELAPKH